MLFDDDFDVNLYMKNINKLNNYDNDNLYNSYEGFSKGNMFKDEYKPYKNYTPFKLDLASQKDMIILKLYETDFALNDISLYLDVYPKDNYIYEKFQKYVSEYEKYKKMYEDKFGALDKTCDYFSEYAWINNPWPWDKFGGIQDV